MDIEILSPERLQYWCRSIDLPEPAVQALEALAQRVRQEERLRGVFEAFYQGTVKAGAWHKEWSALTFDPVVVELLREQTSLFYLLAYLSALPQAWAKYQALGVGRAVFRDTFLDVRYYVCDYQELHGVWGYAHFPWIWRHFAAEIFRLGRLQYMRQPFPGGVHALRRRADGKIVLLADPEQPLRSDGHALGAGLEEGQEADAALGWRPVFERLSDGWRGHVVAPYGFATSAARHFAAEDWELALQPGDPVLDIHIPRSDPLTPETIAPSLRAAAEFFTRLAGQTAAGEAAFKAFFCHTWFFTPQLQQLLPRASALVQFQRQFYLYPNAGGPGFLWDFVFGERFRERATAPRDTRLRRAVLEHLEQGGELFDMPGVYLHQPEDWGSAPYMSAWDAGAETL